MDRSIICEIGALYAGFEGHAFQENWLSLDIAAEAEAKAKVLAVLRLLQELGTLQNKSYFSLF